jgi:serine/threonine protein phosphatase PrpC
MWKRTFGSNFCGKESAASVPTQIILPQRPSASKKHYCSSLFPLCASSSVLFTRPPNTSILSNLFTGAAITNTSLEYYYSTTTPTTELSHTRSKHNITSTHTTMHLGIPGAAPAVTAAFVLTTAAVLSWHQPVPVCRAEKFRFFSSSNKQQQQQQQQQQPEETPLYIPEKKKDSGDTTLYAACPSYGCPLYPIDVHYNTEEYKQALEEMRADKRQVVQSSKASQFLAQHCCRSDAVTLTLIGYKGGDLQSQINQDRGLIVSPFLIEPNTTNTNAETEHNTTITTTPSVQTFLSLPRQLVGVFDGHAPLGERVSEYAAQQLPELLAQKMIQNTMQRFNNSNNSNNHTCETDLFEALSIEITKQSIHEAFVELDQKVPAHPSGGCTATVVLQQGTKLFVANTGDSRSFIVACRSNPHLSSDNPTNTTNSTSTPQLVYISREDKPDLPDERERVERTGGQVYIPMRGTSRVVYHDPVTGAPTGLAMSRSIGDWEAGKMGVIPDPIIDVLDTNAIVARILEQDAQTKQNGNEDDEEDLDAVAYQEVDAVGNIVSESLTSSSSSTRAPPLPRGEEDDVFLFAVSATDGMMDYLSPLDIARILAHALFDPAGAHPVAAVEHLIFAAANAWQQAKQGRYRDDIAISVATVRWPPNHPNHIANPRNNITVNSTTVTTKAAEH